MTTQIYQADDGQLVHEHDQLVPENSPIEPDADLPVAETPLADPDADLPVAETPLADPDADLSVAETPLADPDADLSVAETPLADPADDAALADHESAAVSVSDPGFAAEGDGAAGGELRTADSSPGSPSLVSAAFTVPASVTESHLAGNAASVHGPWNEIQAMFVDDPRASIEQAAGLVDDRVEALIQSLRERQRSMQSAWWADDAGTEELRVALQHYRTFWNILEDLPAQD
jgi:hypothetical protein